MKNFLNVVGILVGVVGLIWFFQGINVIPGSFMTGDPTWAVIGAVCVLAATGLLYYANRRRKT